LPVLEDLLREPQSSNIALIALQAMDFQQVDSLLIDALSDLEGEARIGVINVLGLRKSPLAIEPLNELIGNSDPQVARAAIAALGNIGGRSAVIILEESFRSMGDQKLSIAEALISAVKNSDAGVSPNLYSDIIALNPPVSLKTRAFAGMLNQFESQEERVDLLLETLKEGDSEFNQSLIPLIRDLPTDISLDPVIEQLWIFDSPFRENLILAIADRRDASIQPEVIKLFRSPDEYSRKIALKALKSVGTPEDIMLLINIAAGGDVLEQSLARECIYWMGDPGTDQQLLAHAQDTEGKVQAELMRALGYRKVLEASSFLIGQLSQNDPDIRLAAIETAGMVCGENDLDAVIDKTLAGAREEEKAIIAEAITRISLNSDNLGSCIQKIDASLHETTKALGSEVLIKSLGKIGTEQCLELITPFLNDQNPKVQLASVQAFAAWENDDPLIRLEQFYRNADDQRARQEALAGIVRLTQLSTSMASDEKAAKLIDLFDQAASNSEQVLLINGISRTSSFTALNFISKMTDQDNVRLAAQEAFIRISDNLKYDHADLIINKIDSVATVTDSESFKQKLDILKRSIQLSENE
jgi:HEAT repeat protein